MPEQSQERTATVREKHFNGTATVQIKNVEDKQTAELVAEKFFSQEYGVNHAEVVVESGIGKNNWRAVITIHSSGSLKDPVKIEQ